MDMTNADQTPNKSIELEVVPEFKHLIKRWAIEDNKIIVDRDNGDVFECPYNEHDYPRTRMKVRDTLVTAGFDNIVKDKKDRTQVDNLTIAFSKELLKLRDFYPYIKCKLSPASITQIDVWLRGIGVDIAASDSEGKHPYLEDWGDLLLRDIQYADYEARLKNGFYNKYGYPVNYDKGIAVICGPIRRERTAKFIACFDFDNKEALDKFLELLGMSLEDLAKWTRVEWSGNPGKIHVFFMTKRQWKSGSNGNLDGINGLEIKAWKKLAFVSPSIHKGDGQQYRVYDNGTTAITILDELDQRRIEGLLDFFVRQSTKNSKSYFDSDSSSEYQKYLDEPTTILGPGSRYPNTWLKACSIFFKWKDPKFKDLTDDQRYDKLVEWHNTHCRPSLFEEVGRYNDVENIWAEVCRLNTGRRQQERDQRADEEKRVKDEAKKHAPNMVEKKQAIITSLDENIRNILFENIWTRVSEDPPKFIIARKREGDICRAAIVSHYVTVGFDGGEPQKEKVFSLNYGTTVFRVFPIQITLHESPLKFLDSPPTYTIVFENQSNKRFTLTGSTEVIIQRLREMSGCVVSAYGTAEVLTSIIGAFEDDGNLIVDKSVEFEGYYYADNEIHISKIDFDKKHPVRTKEEVLQCIEYLEKRRKFQVWQYNGRTIDRTDVFASAIQWTVGAPFNFVIKQLSPDNHKRYHRGFDMSGERDGGKTCQSQEMLNIHGNGGQKNVDSFYSVPAGSANTDAKVGKVVSRTTYPIEISEIGTIENYGRDEKLAETYKNAIESIKVREGRKDNRYDAIFPGCSAIILNGNQFISRKGELLKRLHVIPYSKEDRHTNDPKSPFNQLHVSESHLLKILGDWTMRWIWENRHEELLSGKYDGYQIGRWAIFKFYEFAGKAVPEWLTLWITDTSLEELDIDETSLIRSILNDYVNKTTTRSGLDEPSSLYGRIDRCLCNEYWSWIRQVSRKILAGKDAAGKPQYRYEPTNSYYIDTSILEIFRSRLPDLTFKKLAETIGIEPSKDNNGRSVIKCTKQDITNFIEGGFMLEEDIKVGTEQSVLEDFWLRIEGTKV